MLFSEIRDFASLSRSMELLGGLLRDHPIPMWVPMLRYSRAVADSYDLKNNLVVEDLRQGMDAMERSGFVYWRPIFAANLARIYLARGETKLAEKSIEEGNLLIKQGGDSWGGPELARVQADLMLACDASVDNVDSAYREALEKARNYPNKVYELRAACGFAQHYKNTGRVREARALLQTACESVIEPCEIHDFVIAKELLKRLGN